MASPAVTYSLSNGQVIDAAQLNQNFSDIINGITDATKDLSISALTCAGNVSFTGNTTIGNAAGDDLTITASLASTISIKTTASYNIGSSTLGLAGIYLGANSQTVRIVGSGSMSATWTLTLPVTAGTAGYRLITDGSGNTSWSNLSTGATAGTAMIAGNVGEILIQNKTRASMTTITAQSAANVTGTALTLTAGTWAVYGTIGYNSAGGGTIVMPTVNINSSSATVPASTYSGVPNSGIIYHRSQNAATADNDVIISAGPSFLSTTGTTLYLVSFYDSGGSGQISHWGQIYAVRTA